METYRLKNIAIFILLLLNLWLLVLLGFQYLQTRQADSGVDERLRSLYEAGQLALAPSVDALQDPMPPLALSRRVEAEALMAAALLGEGAQAVSQGGGIYSYSTEAGSIQFRSGGSFDGLDLRRQVEDPELQTLLEKRYLNFHTWGQIAVDMGYNVRHLYRIHDRALLEIKIPKVVTGCQ